MSFSERYNHVEKKALQKDEITDLLRRRIWNLISSEIFETRNNQPSYPLPSFLQKQLDAYEKLIYTFFLEQLHWVDEEISKNFANLRKELQHYYFIEAEWYEIYDLLEFIAMNDIIDEEITTNFIKQCNQILEKEMSAYRIINGSVIPITDDQQIDSIQVASNSEYTITQKHLDRALKLLSDRRNYDYANSIKESISAVEALLSKITESSSDSLGKSLDNLEKKGLSIHSALKEGLKKIYGYTSDSGGIRHASKEFEDEVAFEDAKFMLVTCSAFINYLEAKYEKLKY